MRGGALRNAISIEEQTEIGRNALNEPVIEWTAFRAEVFCEKTARRGTEQFDPSTKQRYSETVFRFRCRFSEVTGVTTSMRIVHEGQVYDIKNLMPDDQRHDDCIIEASLQDGHV